ncbi:MAG: hypothetical protein AAF732_14740 [Pseudomonadota bacterium]
MPIAVQSGLFAVVGALIAGALYLAWSRGPAVIVDLSGGLAAIFCL